MSQLTIEVSPHLPYKEFSYYCEIETKREFKVPTGRIVSMLLVGNKILMSADAYESFKSNKGVSLIKPYNKSCYPSDAETALDNYSYLEGLKSHKAELEANIKSDNERLAELEAVQYFQSKLSAFINNHSK